MVQRAIDPAVGDCKVIPGINFALRPLHVLRTPISSFLVVKKWHDALTWSSQ
ncbi:hypothetical protein Plhal304r1_c006g0025681 [Plasmopara halstedii]